MPLSSEGRLRGVGKAFKCSASEDSGLSSPSRSLRGRYLFWAETMARAGWPSAQWG